MKIYLKFALLILIIVLVGGCKKILYGEGKTRVKGQVIDKFSGEPIPGAWVEILAQGDDSWYAAYVIDSIPTDHEGKFDHTFMAEREVNYFARGSYHQLYANYNDLMVDLKDGWGNKRLKLELHPYGWVRTNFINVPPLDTISISSNFNDIQMIYSVWSDTFTIGRRKGNEKTNIVFWIKRFDGIEEKVHFNEELIAFDTLEITVNY